MNVFDYGELLHPRPIRRFAMSQIPILQQQYKAFLSEGINKASETLINSSKSTCLASQEVNLDKDQQKGSVIKETSAKLGLKLPGSPRQGITPIFIRGNTNNSACQMLAYVEESPDTQASKDSYDHETCHSATMVSEFDASTLCQPVWPRPPRCDNRKVFEAALKSFKGPVEWFDDELEFTDSDSE